MGRLLSLLAGLTVVAVFVDLWLALRWSPPERVMGDLVRIMYFHVSCAWIAFLAFFVAFVFSLWYLIRRRHLHDQIAVCSIELGLVYTSLTLITGSLWAKPIWNTWWTWDPRLTTTLILWFLYVGYLFLRGTVTGDEQKARVAAVYAIVAFVDVPIIHMSVTWWRSIHPQAIDETGFHMPGAMVFTLMFSFAAFLLVYLLLLTLRVRQQVQRKRLSDLREMARGIQAASVEHQAR